MKLRTSMTAMALAVATTSFGVQAQENDVIKLSEWNYETFYENGGVQAANLMDTEVFGPEGEEIGSVENMIVSDDNKVVAIIAQVGGIWDIGDTHVAVPWSDVELTDDGVQIPVTEDNAEEYGLFENEYITKQNLQQVTQVDDDVNTGFNTWKMTDLIGDYASLSGGVGYGYVDNVILSEDGEIQAVVIETTGEYGNGTYAYPFYGYDYGWDPGYQAYELPYGEDEVAGLAEFEDDEFDGVFEWN